MSYLNLNGFEAAIRVKKRELPVYGIQVDEAEKTVTCWIPSNPEQKFSVTWKCRKRLTQSRGDVFLDGVGVGSENVREFSWAKMWRSTVSNQKRLTFSKLDDGYGYRSSTDSNLACKHEIRLVINRIGEDRALSNHKQTSDSQARKGETNLDEKKAGHRYRLRGMTRGVSSRSTISEDIIATFIFKYRPLEFLSLNGVLTREPIYRLAIPPESRNSVSMHDVFDGSDKAGLTSQDEDRKGKLDQITTPSDQNMESQISNLQTPLKDLRAMELYKARLAGIGRLRRPKDAPNPQCSAKSKKRKLEGSNYLDNQQEPVPKKIKVEDTTP